MGYRRGWLGHQRVCGIGQRAGGDGGYGDNDPGDHALHDRHRPAQRQRHGDQRSRIRHRLRPGDQRHFDPVWRWVWRVQQRHDWHRRSLCWRHLVGNRIGRHRNERDRNGTRCVVWWCYASNLNGRCYYVGQRIFDQYGLEYV